MAKIVTLGLSKITFEGAQLGLTYQDTCQVTQDDPETTEFYAEEEDDPIEIIERPGAIKCTFSVMDPTEDLAAKAGSTEEGVLVITPKKGLQITFNRARVSYKLDGQYGRGGLMLVTVTATALLPTDGTTKKITVTQVTSKT